MITADYIKKEVKRINELRKRLGINQLNVDYDFTTDLGGEIFAMYLRGQADALQDVVFEQKKR